eukprot:scaffold459_cov117-Isochrysis_galbana.AAC.23
MPESEAEQLARAVRALEPLAEEACSSLQRQLKIAPLALLASLVLSPGEHVVTIFDASFHERGAQRVCTVAGKPPNPADHVSEAVASA